MKHLDLQLERLEERIAPCFCGGNGKSHKTSKSCKSHKSNKSCKSHKSNKSHKSHKSGKDCD